MNPRSETIAFLVWAYCEPRGWNCTYAECAEHIGCHWRAVVGVARKKGWLNRFRTENQSSFYNAGYQEFGYHVQHLGFVE